MRNFLVALAMVIALAGVSLATQPGPRIDFAEKEYHAGEVKQGEIIKHVFEFMNSGDGVLMIHNLSSS